MPIYANGSMGELGSQGRVISEGVRGGGFVYVDGVAQGGPTVSTAVGIQLTSGAQYIHGGAGAFNTTILRAIFRVRLDGHCPNGNGCLVGLTQFGATAGFGILSAAQHASATRGRIAGYLSGVYTDANHIHVLTDDELSQLVTYEVWLDLSAGKIRLFCQGKEIGNGNATALTSLGAAGVVGINTRSNVLGTLPWGACTVVELQVSTTQPTRAEIAAHAAAPVGTTVAGATRHWVAEDLGEAGESAGAAWVDRVGGTSLTIVGSPLLDACALSAVRAVGTIEAFGDSITAGREAGGLGDAGWRRSMLNTLSAAGYFAAANGQFTFTAAGTPLDFDARHTAIGGQALGVATTVASRLSTLATDVTTRGAVDAVSILAYGINDLIRRIDVNGQTAADAASAYLADLGTACATIRVSRTGRIVVQNILRVSSAHTAAVRSAIDLVNAGLPSAVATLNATHGDVVLADVCSVVTPTQADADNTSVLYDGLHESPATKALHGPVMASAVMA